MFWAQSCLLDFCVSYNQPIGDFRVAFHLCFKASPSAKPFMWKLVLFTCKWTKICVSIKLISIWKASHQDSLWNGGEMQLRNRPVGHPRSQGLFPTRWEGRGREKALGTRTLLGLQFLLYLVDPGKWLVRSAKQTHETKSQRGTQMDRLAPMLRKWNSLFRN